MKINKRTNTKVNTNLTDQVQPKYITIMVRHLEEVFGVICEIERGLKQLHVCGRDFCQDYYAAHQDLEKESDH